MAEKNRVLVRGFDFGTTDEQLEGHMGMAGAIQKVKWFNKGTAEVTFNSEAEASAAVDMLNGSTIEGKSRPMEVKIQGEKAISDNKEKNRVFVRGFDFGTTDEELEGHMGQAGAIQNIKWFNKGAAEVTFSSEDEASVAVDMLNGSTIEGKSRPMEVIIQSAKAISENKKRKRDSGNQSQIQMVVDVISQWYGMGAGMGAIQNVSAKTKMVQALALLVGRPPTKADAVWTVEEEKEEGCKTQYVCTLSLPSLDKTFKGEPKASKKGAEHSAAEVGLAALADEIAIAEAEQKEKKDNKNKENLAKLKAAQEAKKAARALAKEA